MYSVIVVRPALVVGHWFAAFDLHVIDGIIHFVARLTHVGVEVGRSVRQRRRRWPGQSGGQCDVPGGRGLRNVQTGFLRSYVLFLVLAAVGIFIVLAYFVRMAMAG